MPYRASLLLVALASAALTAAVAAAPALRFAYRSPSLHVSLETAAALIASLAAFLVAGRFGERRRLSDLLLAFALVPLIVTSLVLAVWPASRHDGFPLWAALAGGVAGSGLLAASAFARDVRVAKPRRAGRLALGGFLVLAALVAGLAVLLAPIDTGIPLALDPTAARRPLLVGIPAVLAAQAASTALFGVAAVGFARRADDELMRWLAAATVLGAFARLNYLLFPSRYMQWVYLGDAFRLAFYLVLLAGAAHEIRRYWHRLADVAVLEERRRIARDLHDGLAQELAFIGATAQGPLAGSARRALDESRMAIAALSRPLDEPIDVLLAQAAEEVAHRHRTSVRCDVDRLDLGRPVRDALVRIVREAVANAARHGAASSIRVELREHVLEVTDDGCGFDPADSPPGHGLTSMRERAAAIGAAFVVDAEPGRGVRVEVALP